MFGNRIKDKKEENKDLNKENIIKRLVDQVSRELYAHNTYLNMSILFDSAGTYNLRDFAKNQASEELEHAHKLISFLSDIGVVYQLGGIHSCTIELLDSDDDFFNVGYLISLGIKKEKELGDNIKETYNLAKDSYPEVAQFLLWYIEEQVEEIAQFESLLSVYKICGNNLLVLDNSDFVKSLINK